ncbi:hydroxymethylbilane synthase [Flavobacteriaceae bacterium 14752]|uniref:hydroxymethylbilane synthase n=1 Tax=Mesohalobacter salilacus TaxID=2491711 RepID=UPI000F63BB23|nr:hydroxymethylbilane synthase [Flavobacteriaceae bacterium 14752]
MKPLIIGTRDSELALWQAKTVQDKLKHNGIESVLHPVKSSGDLNLDVPLYEMGITGIFTKSLDVALIKGEIDLAVHSMKDVPTKLPKTVVEAAVLKRANPYDILIHKGLDFLKKKGHIATGSLRRKAQWLHRYPNHQVSNLRGNVNTRLQKLNEHQWNAAIFAAAGLERIQLTPKNNQIIDWMIPAPAQGAMLVVCKENQPKVLKAAKPLNHQETNICVSIERSFLRTLEGGCTAPIGALAQVKGNEVHFEGVLLSLDGTQRFYIKKKCKFSDYKGFGEACAQDILNQGGDKLMNELRQIL